MQYFEIALADLPFTNKSTAFVLIIGYDATSASQVILVKDPNGNVVKRIGKSSASASITVSSRTLTLNAKPTRFTYQNASLNAPTYLDLNTTVDDAGTTGTIAATGNDSTTVPYWATNEKILLPPQYQISQFATAAGMMAVSGTEEEILRLI